MKTRNLAAKYAVKAGARSAVHRDRKKDAKRGYVKHRNILLHTVTNQGFTSPSDWYRIDLSIEETGMKLSKTQSKLVREIGYCTCRDVWVSFPNNTREVSAAHKLEAVGFGKYRDLSYWDTNAKGNIARFILQGEFIWNKKPILKRKS